MGILPWDENGMNDDQAHMPLLDDKATPCHETLEVFLNPKDRRQQDIFRAIKWSGRHDVIDAYVSAAIAVVTSDAEYGDKDRALTSLVGFVNFGNEGVREWTTHARDVLGNSYYRIHNELSEYFQNEQSLNELHKVFKALASMDYFRVKRTMMMGFIFYEYPKNPIWFVDRLKVVRRALSLTDSEMAWYSLAFLTHSFSELQEVLHAPKTIEQDHIALSEMLDLIQIEIPKWLLCSDWRVVKEAITYCALAKLSDNREIIEQLALSEDDTTSSIAKQALESI